MNSKSISKLDPRVFERAAELFSNPKTYCHEFGACAAIDQAVRGTSRRLPNYRTPYHEFFSFLFASALDPVSEWGFYFGPRMARFDQENVTQEQLQDAHQHRIFALLTAAELVRQAKQEVEAGPQISVFQEAQRRVVKSWASFSCNILTKITRAEWYYRHVEANRAFYEAVFNFEGLLEAGPVNTFNLEEDADDPSDAGAYTARIIALQLAIELLEDGFTAEDFQ